VTEHRAYIGIGTNLGNRVANVERAFAAIAGLGALLARSSVYRTEPWGQPNQPWFANAVALLQTQLPPRDLLDALQAAEQRLGRTPGERWGPRVVDLDILLYDELAVDEPGLRVPHPRLRERAFALVPLAELDARFAALRDALPESEARSVAPLRESDSAMPVRESDSFGERVRALARFLAESDAVRVRIVRHDDEVEVTRRVPESTAFGLAADVPAAEAAPPRIDTIKADLVGIFHASRPAPAEGELFEGDRELGYIEALGIRTLVHSMGGGRLVSIAAIDGAPVEYGQPLFSVARPK
jgi:2-amino-4-hydroxy-6-hydroxymethyldihydropteridine diphosphokinase